MRNGRRKVRSTLVFCLLLGGAPSLAHSEPVSAGVPVRMTVEVAWSTPSASTAAPDGDAGEVALEVSEGRVVEAVAWPDGPTPEPQAGGAWRLGRARSGKVRARVESPVGASLVIRARGQAMRFPLPVVLDGPRRTPPQAPLEVSVERVTWDVMRVDLGPGEGVVEPGAAVPVTVAFDVLTPEPTAVDLACTAELRPVKGGEPVWKDESRRVVPTNTADAPASVFRLRAPEAEGTYVLELRASWEPAPAHEGKIFNRLIRRGKRGIFGTSSATRRVTLVVLGPSDPKPAAAGRDQEVDAVDLARPRPLRPTASGRGPLPAEGRGAWPVPDEALAEVTRRDRLRGLIARGADPATLGPADASGLAWSAVGLKAAHPGRPHRLAVSVTGGHPAALGVALVGASAGGAAPPELRLLLDACASGPPVLPKGPAGSFSWLVWPDSTDPVLLLVNRATGAPVQVGSITLTELGEVPAGPKVEEPAGAPARGLGLYLTGRELGDRFGGSPEGGPADALAPARNLAAYAAYCGTSAVVLPEGPADRARRRALDGQAAEDATGPDRLDLALRVLGRHKIAAWLEVAMDGPLPGLPAADSADALSRGLVRVDRRGLADGPAYYPLCGEVGEAMRRRVGDAAAAHKAHLAGVLIRLGPGCTLPGGPDTGFDDATFARFVQEAFDPATARGVPGASADDPGRFAARAQFLAGAGRMPWLTWRSRRVAALYADLASAVRGSAPAALLAVATPGPDDGPAGAEARRADLAGLAPSLAWRAVGLDLDAWPSGDGAPVVLRGVGLGPDDLTRDLSTSPELDAKVAARPARGLLLDVDTEPRPRTPGALALLSPSLDAGGTGDEPLGHSLAALDARWVWLAASAVAGQEERLRRFARVFRALPAAPPSGPQPSAFGVAVRAHRAAGKTFLAVANDTPYPLRLDAAVSGPADAAVYDLGRESRLRPGADAAGRHLVLDLLPFGASAVRVDAPEVRLASVKTYPSETVLTGMQARYDGLSAQLSRLTRGADRSREKASQAPPNPGFEPEAPARDVPLSIPTPAPAPAAPGGWKATGGAGAAVAIDPARPHSGRGALRLEAPSPPASAVCDDFTPGPHSVLLVRAWLRADRPDAKVKVWIEGEAAGKPYRRVSELTVQPAWAERAVRASDVPPGGLDAARLRFELLTPGSLWVDDVGVSGETLSEPERRNARNALLAALQAYREKRYADFARLSGSHWARHPAAAPAPAATAAGEGSPERVAADRAGLLRTGDGSALPQGRRLR